MTQNRSPEEIQKQAGKILSQAAGYVGIKTLEMGFRFGLFEELARHPQGIKSGELAGVKGLDPLYTNVWCRSAYAAEFLDLESDSFRMAPHMETLLLDQDFGGYLGGLPTVMTQPEIFDVLAANSESGKWIWWDQTGPGWIDGVSGTGPAFYNV